MVADRDDVSLDPGVRTPFDAVDGWRHGMPGAEPGDGSAGEALLQAGLDTVFDGFALLTAVRDRAGRLVDFEFSHVNEVGAKLAGLSPAEMVGFRLTRLSSSTTDSYLLARYIAVVETG